MMKDTSSSDDFWNQIGGERSCWCPEKTGCRQDWTRIGLRPVNRLVTGRGAGWRVGNRPKWRETRAFGQKRCVAPTERTIIDPKRQIIVKIRLEWPKRSCLKLQTAFIVLTNRIRLDIRINQWIIKGILMKSRPLGVLLRCCIINCSIYWHVLKVFDYKCFGGNDLYQETLGKPIWACERIFVNCMYQCCE